VLCRGWLCFLCCCLWLAVATRAAGGEDTAPLIRLSGNRVFIEEVYRELVHLGPGARADQATAARVRDQILGFLRRTGYVLARVKARVQDDAIEVEIDEGRVEKVVFLGRGTLTTLRLKMDLDMPHEVFNQLSLNRQLKSLQVQYQFPSVSYKLIPCQKVSNPTLQLQDLGMLGGQPLIEPSAKYELHILLGQKEWDSGLDLDLEYDFPDGAVVKSSYKDQGLFGQRDRWLVGGQVGAKLRQDLEDDHAYMALSRTVLEAQWFSPPLLRNRFRPFVWLRNELLSRQREDLRLEIYYSERVEGSLNLGYELTKSAMFSLGWGMEYKILFGVEQLPDSPQPIDEHAQARPFFLSRWEWVEDPSSLRRDRRHQIQLEGRYYLVEAEYPLWRASFAYQKVFGFGWHDLWIRSKGVWLDGTVLFDDEEPVGGRYVRGCFGDKYFVEKVSGLALEGRLSLLRDLFKLSIFHDLALFAEKDRAASQERFRVADSFGLGFHALVLDSFQLDVYYGVGFSTDGSFDNGWSLNLRKVF